MFEEPGMDSAGNGVAQKPQTRAVNHIDRVMEAPVNCRQEDAEGAQNDNRPGFREIPDGECAHHRRYATMAGGEGRTGYLKPRKQLLEKGTEEISGSGNVNRRRIGHPRAIDWHYYE